jgi:hypothetical protein
VICRVHFFRFGRDAQRCGVAAQRTRPGASRYRCCGGDAMRPGRAAVRGWIGSGGADRFWYICRKVRQDAEIAKQGLSTTGPWRCLGDAAMLIYRMMSPERPTGTDQQLFLCTAKLANSRVLR